MSVNVKTVNQKLSRGPGRGTVDHLHRCRLSSTVGPQKAEAFAFLDLEVDGVYCY